MIARIVSLALKQRFLVVIASLLVMASGVLSFQKLPIDAYPDLSPPHVEIITQWPGHAAEEVERLVSIEIEMNGIPQLEALRSISLYIFRELAARHGQSYNLLDVIRAAAHDVERPIFYAIAVIIAGYLPIYVLTGPSGRLFQPMADTMSFALLGALLCTLTLLAVLCSYFLRRHVREPSVPVYEWIRRVYGRALGWCLRNRLVTVALVLAVFGCSLALIPSIGAEFMPHLDEGALWVRATRPYTISFEEASRLSPQIRNILLSFPQVTTVANELGRPDDGTDPTGFFNNEFYAGLKPYDNPAWQGAIHTKPQLIAEVQKKLVSFPGIIFNYTQPAEDAVDEAETGLKSALAVKIFGPDLSGSKRKRRRSETSSSKPRALPISPSSASWASPAWSLLRTGPRWPATG